MTGVGEQPRFGAVGWNGSVWLFNEVVMISPQSVRRVLPHEAILQRVGAVGEAIIPYADVTSVEVRRASSLHHGMFAVGTQDAPLGGSFVSVMTHAHSVQFAKRNQGPFLQVKQMLDQLCAASPSPAWYADPAGRFDLRYWDGASWTEHVSSGGRQQVDPGGLTT